MEESMLVTHVMLSVFTPMELWLELESDLQIATQIFTLTVVRISEVA
jgi:hypothetical protein